MIRSPNSDRETLVLIAVVLLVCSLLRLVGNGLADWAGR